MQAALDLAASPDTLPDLPIAAMLVHRENGKIIAQSANRVERDNDPTAHAEMIVIREGAALINEKYLTDYDLYVTLEPCAMCAQAIAHARIGRLFFGAYDPKSGGVDHGACVFSHPQCHHVPQVVGGLMEGKCAALLKRFFTGRRH